jgi:hypothetical protein
VSRNFLPLNPPTAYKRLEYATTPTLALGGSDGSHSLKSVEVLENNSFILGPQMSIGRANVGVVAYSNRLYAVGTKRY